MEEEKIQVRTMSQLAAEGKKPEILFWVGCAGSYDARAQKVSVAFSKILNAAGIDFAILGDEEVCTGDPARRAGNEFLFQMLAHQNIGTLDQYGITKIVATCPHCFNTLKNEYPVLGGHYEVIHHTQLLDQLLKEGRIKLKEDDNRAPVTYHDSCYMGRANGVYEAPRNVIAALKVELQEMPRHASNGLCCGAGGAQMFKEDEPGRKRINTERIEEALGTNTKAVVSNCPFCLTMLSDGVKEKDKQGEFMVYDLSELVLQHLDK
ncbi:MAG: (Fe-S)-binding protein [Saprospiraceae bacterium]